MKIKGILVDVYNQTIEEHEVNYKGIRDYYKILKTDICSHKFLNINGIYVSCYFDDLGKLRNDRFLIPGLLMVQKKNKEVVDFICGNIWICKFDGVEDDCSLEDEEITQVLSAIKHICLDRYDSSNKFKVLVSEDNYISLSERYKICD